MTKLEKLRKRALAMKDIGPDDARWFLERVDELAKVARAAMGTASISTCKLAKDALAKLEKP